MRRVLLSLLLSVSLLPASRAVSQEAVSQERGASAGKQVDSNSAPTAGEFLTLDVTPTRSRQRTANFLEFPNDVERLQIAFVLDGTESMGREFASLQDNLTKVAQGLETRGGGEDGVQVEFALVIFRDLSPDREAVELQPKFWPSVEEFRQHLARQTTASGHPKFEERVDDGLYHAMTRLPWSEDATRWIVLCGDAPPHPDPRQTKAPDPLGLRAYSDETLIQTAQERGIAIFSILTNSQPSDDAARFASQSPQELEAFREGVMREARAHRPTAAAFMQKLARATGGKFVDVASPHYNYWIIDSQALPAITPEEIHALRRTGGGFVSRTEPLRVAVLPHVAWSSLAEAASASSPPGASDEKFFRDRLEQLTGVRVVDPVEVRQALQGVTVGVTRSGGASDETAKAVLAQVAKRVNADLVVWGERKTFFDYVWLSSAAYEGRSGELLAKARYDAHQGDADELRDLGGRVLGDLLRQTARAMRSRADMEAWAHVLAPVASRTVYRRRVTAPLSRRHLTHANLLEALEHVERSVLAEDGSDPKKEALRLATGHLEAALRFEKNNPLAHFLLAHCEYNGRERDDPQRFAAYCKHLTEARKHLEELEGAPRLEIEAEYQLSVLREVEDAVACYEQLLAMEGDAWDHFRMRAHWMLAGIRLGDWGAASYAPHLIDHNQARWHILNLLAFWEGSPQAEYYRSLVDATGDQPRPEVFVRRDALVAKSQ